MNRIALLFASLTLVSCATKPWMVGSANDRCFCGPWVKVPGGVWTPPAAPPPPPPPPQEMPVTRSGKSPVRVQ